MKGRFDVLRRSRLINSGPPETDAISAKNIYKKHPIQNTIVELSAN
jgi:hypothetical protein